MNEPDITAYDWDKSHFPKFEKFLETKDPHPNYGKYTIVIDWVIENQLNARKAFFGISMGSNPYNSSAICGIAEQFYAQFELWKAHRYKSWFGGKMSNPSFKEDFEEGYRDGWWDQPTKKDTEGYSIGYRTGWVRHTRPGGS